MRVDQARAAVRGLEAKLALIADQVAAQTSKAGAAAIAKLSALIPTMVHELAKADSRPFWKLGRKSPRSSAERWLGVRPLVG
jgi:hypothetical protein